MMTAMVAAQTSRAAMPRNRGEKMNYTYLFAILAVGLLLAGCASKVSDDTGKDQMMDNTEGQAQATDVPLQDAGSVEDTNDILSDELDNSEDMLDDW